MCQTIKQTPISPAQSLPFLRVRRHPWGAGASGGGAGANRGSDSAACNETPWPTCVFLLPLISWFRNLGLFLLCSTGHLRTWSLCGTRYHSSTTAVDLRRTGAQVPTQACFIPVTANVLQCLTPASRRNILNLRFFVLCRFTLYTLLSFYMPWVFLALPLEGILVLVFGFFWLYSVACGILGSCGAGHDSESTACQGMFSFFSESVSPPWAVCEIAMSHS